MAAGLGVARWLNRPHDETYTAFLAARTRLVTAPVAGRVPEILIEEGQTVETGQNLLVIAEDEVEPRRSAHAGRVTSLERELAQAQAKVEVDLAWRLRELNAEILQTRLNSARFLKAQFDEQLGTHAWRDVADDQEMIAGVATPESVFRTASLPEISPDKSKIQALLKHEAASNAAEVSAVQIRLCDERLAELEKLKSQLPEKISQALGIAIIEAKLTQAQSELEALTESPSETPVLSPSYGTVGVYRVHVGEQIDAGTPIVEILDEDRRYLTVRIPTDALTSFAAESLVELHFGDGEPRTGKILRIPPQTTQADTTPHNQEAYVKLHIEPVDKLWPNVPIGTAVRVNPAPASH
jgi:multidrug efflux pump subunit AcrA (membrane-fusion protein)